MSKALLKRCRDMIENYPNGWPTDEESAKIKSILADIDAAIATKPKPSADPTALSLSKELIDALTTATGKKLLTTPEQCAPAIKKLLKRVSEADIKKVVNWLATENPKREYPFAILSAKSLYDKWDRVVQAMEMSKPQQPKGNYW